MQAETLMLVGLCALAMGAKKPCSRHEFEIRAAGNPGALVRGADVVDATLGSASHGPEVKLGLSPKASRRLARFTASHLGVRLEVVVDGKTVQRPVIRDPIKGGKLVLSGLDKAAAHALVKDLSCHK